MELIRKQGEQILDLEKLYSQEMTLRKKYFNMMEDMKGKIRVYARARPLTDRETQEGQKMVVQWPDDFTVEHPWKDGDKPRQHQVDHVFPDSATQDDIFEDTKVKFRHWIHFLGLILFLPFYGVLWSFLWFYSTLSSQPSMGTMSAFLPMDKQVPERPSQFTGLLKTRESLQGQLMNSSGA